MKNIILVMMSLIFVSLSIESFGQTKNSVLKNEYKKEMYSLEDAKTQFWVLVNAMDQEDANVFNGPHLVWQQWAAAWNNSKAGKASGIIANTKDATYSIFTNPELIELRKSNFNAQDNKLSCVDLDGQGWSFCEGRNPRAGEWSIIAKSTGEDLVSLWCANAVKNNVSPSSHNTTKKVVRDTVYVKSDNGEIHIHNNITIENNGNATANGGTVLTPSQGLPGQQQFFQQPMPMWNPGWGVAQPMWNQMLMMPQQQWGMNMWNAFGHMPQNVQQTVVNNHYAQNTYCPPPQSAGPIRVPVPQGNSGTTWTPNNGGSSTAWGPNNGGSSGGGGFNPNNGGNSGNSGFSPGTGGRSFTPNNGRNVASYGNRGYTAQPVQRYNTPVQRSTGASSYGRGR